MDDRARTEPGAPLNDPTEGDAVEIDRRRFFRAFAADAIQLAATVSGAAGALAAASAEAAGSLVDAPGRAVAGTGAGSAPATSGGPAAVRPAGPAVTSAVTRATPPDGMSEVAPAELPAESSIAPPAELPPAAPAPAYGPAIDRANPADERTAGSRVPAPGFRTPYRLDAEAIVLLDQRRLPDEVVEVRCLGGTDVALAIKDLVVRGAPVLGQVAAYGLALSAGRVARSAPWVRRATISGTADALRRARPTAVNVAWALDRMLARLAAEDGDEVDGRAIAGALRAEADAIAAEATADHTRMAGLAIDLLPWFADRPTRLLTHCNTGPLACGEVGTALGVVQVAHAEGRRLHVYADETRPWLQGARLTAWELAQAGVPHTLLVDAAAGWLLASGQVDAVLVGADRIAANGDTANKIGTYPLAVLAGRHGVPFLVVAPTSSVDLGAADGAAIPIETRIADEVLSVRGQRIAPAGAAAINPVFDVTPAELITAIVTEEGALRSPYGAALAAAVSAARVRRPRADGPVGAGAEP